MWRHKPRVIGVLYFIPIVVSLFVSTTKRMIYLAIMALITFLITVTFYQNHEISVWCFFAAVTSLMVLWVLYSIANVRRQSSPD